MICAPAGNVSIALLRACTTVRLVLASAWPSAGESERQNTSGAESLVFVPHAPMVPTTGAGVLAAHSCPKVLPISAKSPC